MPRPPAPPTLLTCALCAALLLAACHRKPAKDQADASSRRLTVEAYDAPVPKAPLKGRRLETMTVRPRSAAVPTSDAPPASAVPPPASSSPPALPQG